MQSESVFITEHNDETITGRAIAVRLVKTHFFNIAQWFLSQENLKTSKTKKWCSQKNCFKLAKRRKKIASRKISRKKERQLARNRVKEDAVCSFYVGTTVKKVKLCQIRTFGAILYETKEKKLPYRKHGWSFWKYSWFKQFTQSFISGNVTTTTSLNKEPLIVKFKAKAPNISIGKNSKITKLE